jgi:hypothetical protein
MANPNDEYTQRAGGYRLLSAFTSPDPAVYKKALDAAMADPALRETISFLVGVSLGSFILKNAGDMGAAINQVARELRAAEDLAGMPSTDE